MTKTEHYQLNQWDPEDRILRVDFNADNAAIDAALKENADTAAAGLAAETSARTAADTAIRTDFAAADTKIRTDFAAADTTIRNSLTTETTNRTNQDAAIRKEFAAADTTVEGKISMVKLYETTTTSNATQINVSVSSLNLTQYREVIVIPTIGLSVSGQALIYVRVNNLSESGYYYKSNSSQTYLTSFLPASGHSSVNMNGSAKLNLSLCGQHLTCRVQYQTLSSSYTEGSGVLSTKLAPSAVTALNFVTSNTSYPLASGSKITIYGVR